MKVPFFTPLNLPVRAMGVEALCLDFCWPRPASLHAAEVAAARHIRSEAAILSDNKLQLLAIYNH